MITQESYDELLARCNLLEEERNLRLKNDMALAEAKAVVDEENSRLKVIQGFTNSAMGLKDKSEILELALEAVIEAFEYENALYIEPGTRPGEFKIILDFQGDLIGEEIHLPEIQKANHDPFIVDLENSNLDLWSEVRLQHFLVGVLDISEIDHSGLLISRKH